MVFGEPVCLSQQRSMPGDHHTPQCSLGQLASAWHRGLEQVLSWGSQSVPSSWMTLCKWQQHLKAWGAAPEGPILGRTSSGLLFCLGNHSEVCGNGAAELIMNNKATDESPASSCLSFPRSPWHCLAWRAPPRHRGRQNGETEHRLASGGLAAGCRCHPLAVGPWAGKLPSYTGSISLSSGLLTLCEEEDKAKGSAGGLGCTCQMG